MKYVLLAALITTSCASKRIENYITDAANDSMATEALIRYTPNRLEQLTTIGPILKSVAQCHAGEAKKGLGQLKKIMKSNRNNASYWNAVGTCFYLDNNPPKAEFFYQLAIETAKKQKFGFAPAYNNLGVLAMQKSRPEEAIKNFKSASRLNPRLITPRFNLAGAYLMWAKANKALSILRPLQRDKQGDPDILAAMASAYLTQGKSKLALEMIDKIDIKIRSRQDIALYRATALYGLKQYTEAEKVLSTSESPDVPLIAKGHATLRDSITSRLEEIERQKEKEEKMRKLASTKQ